MAPTFWGLFKHLERVSKRLAESWACQLAFHCLWIGQEHEAQQACAVPRAWGRQCVKPWKLCAQGKAEKEEQAADYSQGHPPCPSHSSALPPLHVDHIRVSGSSGWRLVAPHFCINYFVSCTHSLHTLLVRIARLGQGPQSKPREAQHSKKVNR